MMDLFAVFLQNIPLPFAYVRDALALIALSVFSFYDLTNNKNIPDHLIFLALLAALAINLVKPVPELAQYFLVVDAPVILLLILLSTMGYLGSADVYAFAIIALLRPFVRTRFFNVPTIPMLILISGILFSIYFVLTTLTNCIAKRKKGEWQYLVLLPLYLIPLYFLYTSGALRIEWLAALLVLVFASVSYLVYKKAILKALAEEVPVEKLGEEDVIATELMPNTDNLPRVVTEKTKAELKKKGIKKVWIYTKLPPFMPFILLSFIALPFIQPMLVP